MITLLTGLPGNGKTLYALTYIKAYAEKEKREVFYSGIKDLLLPWTEIKPEDWMALPAGAIIIIDEAQFVFSKRPNGSKLPDFYEKLATHRHNGFDIFFITQHPSLIDNFVRKLVGRHFHVVRKFGMSRATVYEWGASNDSPEKPASQKTAISLAWSYPKTSYEFYKSAEVHTVKRSIPAKLILAIFFVFFVFVFGYYVLQKFKDRTKKPESVQSSSVQSSTVSSSASKNDAYLDPLADAKKYVFEHQPRIAGVEFSAPRYDEITKPIAAPVPAACIAKKNDWCKCYSQQGTKMAVELNTCRKIVENGFFQDFDPGKKNNDPAVRPGAVGGQSVSLAPVPLDPRVSGVPVAAPELSPVVSFSDGSVNASAHVPALKLNPVR